MNTFSGAPYGPFSPQPRRLPSIRAFLLVSVVAHAAGFIGLGVGRPPPLWNANQPLQVVMAPTPSRLLTPAVVSETVAKVPTGSAPVARWHAPQPAEAAVVERLLGVALPAAVESEIFFRPWELDQRAEPKTPIVFRFPDVPPGTSPVGVVRVELRIDELGAVVAAEVLDAKPAKIFDQAAIAALSGVAFDAAMRGGKAVKSLKIIEVVFERDGALGRPTTLIGNGEAVSDRTLVVGEKRE